MRAVMAIGLAMINVAWPSAAAGRRAAAVTLRIHDYAGVPAGALARAQRRVTSLYDRVGVRTRWARTVERRFSGGDPNASEPLEDVTVIVLNREMAERKPSTGRGTLGFAAMTRRPPGRVAYVIYDQVDATAVDSDWTPADLLSMVIAHEIAHLYLPPGSHSPNGVMRGEWTIDDLRRTDPASLRFTAHQAELLRAGVGGPPAASAAAETQMVGELRVAGTRSHARRTAGQLLKRRQSMPYLRTR